MPPKNGVSEKVLELTGPVLEALGFELVDLVYRREGGEWVLRFFIDREGGVTLDDCVTISREVGALIEVEEVISNAYRLEVSSPGLDRPLKKESDFSRFNGRLAKVKMHERIDPDGRGHERKTFVGRLRGLDGSDVLLELTDKRGGLARLPLSDIDQANLEIEV